MYNNYFIDYTRIIYIYHTFYFTHIRVRTRMYNIFASVLYIYYIFYNVHNNIYNTMYLFDIFISLYIYIYTTYIYTL